MQNFYDNNDNTSVNLQPNAFTSNRAYRDYLVDTHLELVESLARSVMFKFKNSYTLCVGDLISAGEEALVLASRSYDPAKGVAFCAYATRAIQHAMHNELRRMLPVDPKTAWNTEDKSLGYKTFFDDSILNSSENPEPDSWKLYEQGQWLNNWEEEEQYWKDCLTVALGRLDAKDRDLIEDYYGINGEAMTLNQLGEQHEVSFQAVAKKKKRVLEQLRADLDREYRYGRCA